MSRISRLIKSIIYKPIKIWAINEFTDLVKLKGKPKKHVREIKRCILCKQERECPFIIKEIVYKRSDDESFDEMKKIFDEVRKSGSAHVCRECGILLKL